MYILKDRETGEYVASEYKVWGGYKNVTLRELKENHIFFSPNDAIKKLFSVNYHTHFRGSIPIKLHDCSKIWNFEEEFSNTTRKIKNISYDEKIKILQDDLKKCKKSNNINFEEEIVLKKNYKPNQNTSKNEKL